MTTLTTHQRRHLERHQRLVVDLADAIAAIGDQLPVAHHAAALITTTDTPASTWRTDPSHAPGTHSDPTAQAAISDMSAIHQLEQLTGTLIALRDGTYDAANLIGRITRRLDHSGGREGDRQADELHDHNIGRGDCAACGRTCTGTDDDRLRTIRPEGTLRGETELRVCNACRMAWIRHAETTAEPNPWTWSDMRRRRVERKAG